MDGRYASDRRDYTATVTNNADEVVITLVHKTKPCAR